MRRLVCLVALAALAYRPAAAQSESGESRSRAKVCAECERDSVMRVMQVYRLRHRDAAERISTLALELAAVRRTLDAEHGLAPAARRRLERRANTLEARIRDAGKGLGIGVAAQALEHAGPAVAEAQRAVAAALAEAGAVAVAAVPAEAVRFDGWIGITLDAPSAVEARGRDVYWRFFHHPEIVSVDPSSPAEQAGIRQGDVLLAYNGRDVRREIAMNRLLQPGRIVRVRVRSGRENEVRDVPVKVGIAPDRVVWRVEPTPARRPLRTPHDASVGGAPVAGGRMTIVRSPAPFVGFAHLNGVAGAHMETITPGLGEAIGIERGVLVIAAAPGGPAHESGLKDGDVILKANGRDVESVQEIRRLVMRNGDRALTLHVVRKGKVRQVTLRW